MGSINNALKTVKLYHGLKDYTGLCKGCPILEEIDLDYIHNPEIIENVNMMLADCPNIKLLDFRNLNIKEELVYDIVNTLTTKDSNNTNSYIYINTENVKDTTINNRWNIIDSELVDQWGTDCEFSLEDDNTNIVQGWMVNIK